MNTCLITGGTKRLGRATALFFAEKGWNIILHYRNDDNLASVIDEISQFDVQVFPIQFDLNNIDDIDTSFLHIHNHFPFPNVLVNNAAIYPNQISLKDTSANDWDNVINTNLRSIFFMAKAFANYAMPNSKIINIASIGAHKVFKKRILYNLSKNGVVHLTKLLAVELAPNISVNAVSPGYIDFDNNKNIINIPSLDNVPMKRYAYPNDINNAIYYFASANNFVTGQNIIVDGGMSL